MTWVIGNVPSYKAIEIFNQTLRTAAPITGDETASSVAVETFDGPVPTTVEEWIAEQQGGPEFLRTLDSIPEAASREGLYLYAPNGIPPRILVPPRTREPLIRFTHARMFHLGQAKVAERLLQSYFWQTLQRDTRHAHNDCPECENEKARQNQAHGLFRARPNDAL
jgi:hypothetical protein